MRRISLGILTTALIGAALLTGCDSDSGDETVDGIDGTSATDGTSAADATSGTDGTDATDATSGTDGTEGPTEHPFRFGIDADQNVSEGPFPSDLYIGSNGKVRLAPLHTDPVVSTLGKPELLELMTTQSAERTGFGVGSAVWFFMNEAPDPTTLEGNVHMVALEGPEAGRTVAVQLKWNARANAIGVFPAWGDYLVPASTYGVYLTYGIKAVDGREINHHPDFVAAVAPTGPTGDSHTAIRAAFEPLRKWVGDSANNTDISTLLIGTVFRTEPVVDYTRQVFAAIDNWTLQRPSLDYRYDEDAAKFEQAAAVVDDQVDLYFGVPEAPFEHNPGVWDGNRTRALSLAGYEKEYMGGTGHFRIGKVLNGSVVMPSFNHVLKDGNVIAAPLRFVDGKAVSDVNTMVPFTIFLCKDHLGSTSKLPVAIFSHGGGAIRSDAIAFANANCEVGVATAAVDMVFHGGRRKFAWVEGAKLIVPTESDTINVFSGKEAGDDGYVPDYIGDPGGAAASVSQLYGVNNGADPLVIEANELTISADTYTFARYLLEGDWSDISPDLAFDDALVFHNSLSFGTSYSTPVLALTDVFKGIIGSVGTAYILGVNMPQAPANSLQASGLLIALLGIKGIPTSELQAESQWSIMLGIHQWMHGRGDSMPYAPYILRYRDSKRPDVVHTGNSWDETLHNPSQFSYANALGLVSYTFGSEWTLDPSVPGSSLITATEMPAEGVMNNVTYGGEEVSAAILWRNVACHSQAISSLCTESFEHPYPPVTSLDTPIVSESPLCAIAAQSITFTDTLLAGPTARIVPPVGTCTDTFAP